MSADRIVSLAAGTVLDASPPHAVEVAAAAGFDAAGLWFDPDAWTDRTTRAVAAALDEHGLSALDIEPVILGRGPDPGDRILDVAAALGVANVLVASGPAPHGEVVDRVARLSERAAPGIVLVVEFLPIFSVATLSDALRVVADVAAGNVGVLVDTLHLDRSGGRPSDLQQVDRARLPYLQIADAPAQRPESPAALREEALHGRLLPGEGALPLAEVLAAVADVPLSVELRSRALVERHPDPIERARVVRAACRRLLAEDGPERSDRPGRPA